MKANYFYISIIIIFAFVIGFLLGSKKNENGRFQTKDLILTTDTQEGIIYIYNGNEITSINLLTGEKNINRVKKNSTD